MPKITKLDHALDACSRGLRVFPADGKRPRIRDWPHNASAKATVAERHWTRWPDADIAVALDPDTYVFDTDTPAAAAMYLSLSLPPTLTIETARGHHYYFRVPHELARMAGGGAGLHAIEGKGAPGPVHWAGSVHHAGHVYRIAVDRPIVPMPQSLIDAIGPKRATRDSRDVTDEERADYDSRNRCARKLLGADWLADAQGDRAHVAHMLRSDLPLMPTGWADHLFRAAAYLGPHVATGALGLDATIEELTDIFTALDTQKSDSGHALRSIERGVAVGAREALR